MSGVSAFGLDPSVDAFCTRCTNIIPQGRLALGIRLCLPCGEAQSRRDASRRTIVPSHKGAYQPVGDRKYLKMLNKYAGE